jgi:hypothetical protein
VTQPHARTVLVRLPVPTASPTPAETRWGRQRQRCQHEPLRHLPRQRVTRRCGHVTASQADCRLRAPRADWGPKLGTTRTLQRPAWGQTQTQRTSAAAAPGPCRQHPPQRQCQCQKQYHPRCRRQRRRERSPLAPVTQPGCYPGTVQPGATWVTSRRLHWPLRQRASARPLSRVTAWRDARAVTGLKND